MSMEDEVKALASTPLFCSVDPSQLKLISMMADLRSLRRRRGYHHARGRSRSSFRSSSRENRGLCFRGRRGADRG